MKDYKIEATLQVKVPLIISCEGEPTTADVCHALIDYDIVNIIENKAIAMDITADNVEFEIVE